MLAAIPVLTFVSLVCAKSNAFTYPVGKDLSVDAGTTMNIKWMNVSGKYAKLLLRTGDPKHLETVHTIASNITNQGSYKWTIPAKLQSGSYSIEILSDGEENYSALFHIKGTNKPVRSSIVTSGSPFVNRTRCAKKHSSTGNSSSTAIRRTGTTEATKTADTAATSESSSTQKSDSRSSGSKKPSKKIQNGASAWGISPAALGGAIVASSLLLL